MKHLFLTGLLTLTSAASIQAAGLMQPINSRLPALEIREQHVDVVIEDGYAVTEIEQVFYNPNGESLEALYSFPVPEHAAVGEFTYWIDDQPVTGEVVEKQQAREIYQEQKSQGKSVAMAEQDSYRTFDMQVYPVPAKDSVKLRLVYVQKADIESGIGRYVYPLEEGGVDEQRDAFWSRNEVVEQAFSFDMTFRSSYPIDALRLPKHPQASIQQHSPQEWQVSLSSSNASEGAAPSPAMILDQDILVYWRLQEGLPGSLDLLTYRDSEQEPGTFMMTLTPGDDLGVIEQGRDWVFVLDVSGSMTGKFTTLADGVRQGLQKLRPDDRFRIVTFDDSTRDLTRGYRPVTPEEVEEALTKVASLTASGGTNLYRGLTAGLNDLDEDRPSALVLVTDGVANVGTTEKKAFFNLLQDQDVRLYTFILGNSANRPLLEEMTKLSHGFAQSISNADDIGGQLQIAASKLTHNAYRDIDISIVGAKVSDLTPLNPGSLYRGEQLVVFGHYEKPGLADIQIKARFGDEQRVYKTQVDFPETDSLNPELERLWAYASIHQLSEMADYLGDDKEFKPAITELAVNYGLVTDYTSMIVVDEVTFEEMGIARNNKVRVEKEQVAREQRANQPVRNHRADAEQPLYSSNRPSTGGSGAGAFNLGWLLALLACGGLMSTTAKSRRERLA